MRVEPGENRFPFRFQIPMDAKPSYEKRTKKHFVYNRYYFGAYAIKANVNEEGEFKIKSDQFPEDVNPLRKWYKCKEHLHCRGQVDPFALHRSQNLARPSRNISRKPSLLSGKLITRIKLNKIWYYPAE